MPQSIHFIAIGGRVMHDLALTLQQAGHTVTGSDDVLYEPSHTRLSQHGLLPAELGWFPDKVHARLDTVIVGMHTQPDNPELLRAQQLNLPIFSLPEYIYQHSQQKQRIVIAGSHGKTTITAMLMHVLTFHQRAFDYLVGTQLNGFDSTVRLSKMAPLIVIEGDAYTSSPIDMTPKFLNYQPHIALISGIAWDHVSVYPSWDLYVDQFETLAEAMPKAGILIFDEADNMLDIIGQKERTDITKVPYQPHPSEIVNGQTYLLPRKGGKIPVPVFGEHNMKNIAAALTVCDRIGITDDQFYAAIPTFKAVTRRLEQVAERAGKRLFHDFAYAPAKVEATTEAVKKQFPKDTLLAVAELHAANLLPAFLDEYRQSLDQADLAAVFIDPSTLSDDQPMADADSIRTAFGRPDLTVFTSSSELRQYLLDNRDKATIFLLMSAGTFGDLNMTDLADVLL
ncbi:UDP-N-acetylmuramate--L-alanine ligase [Spirosoma rhododendri]|uniref:Peptidoglycan synthetase n=1 Tax=Spirosoma rhododendri TaxID=2728024 RepID=A0A7L5DQK7_9BACT|nr:Mur ligase family protein [Spirosoma rhododendri]QJD77940.1 peptidoglycan synthetase [Spirosoma rhododendri]